MRLASSLTFALLLTACGAPRVVPVAPPPAPTPISSAPAPIPTAPPTEPPPAPATEAPPPPGPTRYPADAIRSPVTPAVVDALRAIAARGPALDPRRFLKAGSSGTVNPHFLGCFAGREGPFHRVDLGEHAALADTLAWFRPQRPGEPNVFSRWSKAAETSRTAAWALRGEPAPLRAELDALHPRFAVVEFGTNDMVMAMTPRAALFPFADRLGAVLDTLTNAGVVPLVTGVGPRAYVPATSAWLPTYDAVTRGLSEARQVPHLSLWQALRVLPGQGLGHDGMHANALKTGTIATPCVFTPEGLRFGYNVRNLHTLTLLDALRRTVLDPAEPAPDAPPRPPLVGAGTDEAPFRVDALPFTHAGPGPAGAPARVYALTLDAPTPLRALVLTPVRARQPVTTLKISDAAGVEVMTKRRDPRVFEATLPAGAYTLRLEGGTGAELLVALACEAADPDCR